jgi:hypothetical protein
MDPLWTTGSPPKGEGLWTAAHTHFPGRLRSPTGGPGATPGGFNAAPGGLGLGQGG